jgi:hypothetical protein
MSSVWVLYVVIEIFGKPLFVLYPLNFCVRKRGKLEGVLAHYLRLNLCPVILKDLSCIGSHSVLVMSNELGRHV